MENEESLPFGTRVEIGGRTMLRPGFSLVGLTGMVYLPVPNIPPGCTTVIVDWKTHGYTPENGYPDDSLPPLVNVPTQHLEIFEGDIEAPEPQPKAKFVPPKDRIDPRENRKPGNDNPDNDNNEDNERPKLRLV